MSIEIPKVWRSEFPLLIVFLVTVVLSIVLSAEFPWLIVKGSLFSLGSVDISLYLPVLWFVPFFTLCFALYRIYDVKYLIDSSGLETVTGILGLNQRRVRIRFEDIRSVRTFQGIVERALDIGHIEVGTAATSDLEIIFEGVASPLIIQQMIEREKESKSKQIPPYSPQAAENE